MPIMRTYQCPECNGYFDHLHMHATDAPPSFCVLCGASTAEVTPELSAPHISKTIGKATDQVYRAMEDSSQHRAELAAEAAGVDVSEMSAMKLTNMRDDTREGENSVKVEATPVSTFMANTGVGGMQTAEAAAGFAAAAATGPFARQGNKTMTDVVRSHRQVASQVEMRGNLGSHKG